MHTDTTADDVSADLTGRFLKQADLDNGPQVFTIARVEKTTFPAQGARPSETKWVVFFHEEDRALSLNKTNLALLAKWFGNKSRAWAGKTIVVFVDETVQYAGRLTGGLRVRRPTRDDPKPLSGSRGSGTSQKRTPDPETDVDAEPPF